MRWTETSRDSSEHPLSSGSSSKVGFADDAFLVAEFPGFVNDWDERSLRMIGLTEGCSPFLVEIGDANDENEAARRAMAVTRRDPATTRLPSACLDTRRPSSVGRAILPRR